MRYARGLGGFLKQPLSLADCRHRIEQQVLGLWGALPTGWWFVELVFVGLAGWYYLSRARESDAFGARPLAVLLLALLLHISNSPWLSPL